MRNDAVSKFDEWIRSRFKDLNTDLEEAYFLLDDPAEVEGHLDHVKASLHDEGRKLIAAIISGPHDVAPWN